MSYQVLSKTTNQTIIPVYSLPLTQQLLDMGFTIVKITLNKKDSTKQVYYFREEPNLQEAINYYKNKNLLK